MAYEVRLPQVFRQTDRMNCWFYAAKTIVFARTSRMLLEADYRDMTSSAVPVAAGRGSGVSSWLAHGLHPRDVGRFAEVFGFAEPRARPATWTSAQLESTLREYGPLWFGGVNGSFAHVVVVSGINAQSQVSYGDPASGGVHRAPLDQFNAWKQQTVGLPNPLYFARR